jgi:hypothetical protein
MLPYYQATVIVFISREDLSNYSSTLPKRSEIVFIGNNEIEQFLNQQFPSCIEFIDYLNNQGIRKFYKYTNKELVDEYYKLKNELNKGYVSGLDVNLHSRFNWMLYKSRFGTWKIFLEEIGEDTDRFKEITADDLKETYLKIKSKLSNKSLTLDNFIDYSHYSEHPINRLFGNWKNLVIEMEGNHSNSVYSDKELVDEYYRIKKKLGKELISTKDMNKHGKFSSVVVSWRYGSWSNFLNIIGEGESKWKKKNEQDLIDDYNRVKNLLNKDRILWSDMLIHGKYNPHNYIYVFGNWGTFLKIMRGEITKDTYSEEELINEYNKVKLKIMKEVLTASDLKLHSKFPPYIYQMKFGSLRNFFDKMGVTQKTYEEITAEELKLEYHRICNILNKKKLTLKEFKPLSQFSQNLVKKHFGSWNGFIKEIGEEVFKTHISDEELVKEYYRVKNEFKKEYISKDFMNKQGRICSSTYIHRYGTWGNFLKKLGEELDYLKAKKIEFEKNK